MDYWYYNGWYGANYTYHKLELTLKLHPDDVIDVNFMRVKAIVTKAKSYDFLIGAMVLYPMGFFLDFWKERSLHRLRQ